MKTIQGAFFLPSSNRSRTRDAPTPTNISTKSDPLIEKNGTLASPATARANRVLPVPGAPTSSTPLGIRPPSFWNFCGSFRNSMISWSSSLASSTPATSLNVTFFWELDDRFARLFPIDRRLLPPLCIRRMKKTKNPMIRRSGAHENSRVAHGLRAAFLAVTATSRSTSVLTRPSYCGGAYVRNRSPDLDDPVILLPVSVTLSTCPASTH